MSNKSLMPTAMLIAGMALAMPPTGVWSRSPRLDFPRGPEELDRNHHADEEAFQPRGPLSNPRRVFNYRRPLLSPEAVAWALEPDNRERLERAQYLADVRREERRGRKALFRVRQASRPFCFAY